MKMKDNDYRQLEAAINKVIESHPGVRENYVSQGLSDMRYRWDLLWASKFNARKFYDYLNDDHIDTALRKITGAKEKVLIS
jgi:hypothetical protein